MLYINRVPTVPFEFRTKKENLVMIATKSSASTTLAGFQTFSISSCKCITRITMPGDYRWIGSSQGRNCTRRADSRWKLSRTSSYLLPNDLFRLSKQCRGTSLMSSATSFDGLFYRL